jgi:hypothetical protein
MQGLSEWGRLVSTGMVNGEEHAGDSQDLVKKLGNV